VWLSNLPVEQATAFFDSAKALYRPQGDDVGVAAVFAHAQRLAGELEASWLEITTRSKSNSEVN